MIDHDELLARADRYAKAMSSTGAGQVIGQLIDELRATLATQADLRAAIATIAEAWEYMVGDLPNNIRKAITGELGDVQAAIEVAVVTSDPFGVKQVPAAAGSVTPEACPAGGEHVWTDEVGPEHERTPRAQRIHCDECGATPEDDT